MALLQIAIYVKVGISTPLWMRAFLFLKLIFSTNRIEPNLLLRLIYKWLYVILSPHKRLRYLISKALSLLEIWDEISAAFRLLTSVGVEISAASLKMAPNFRGSGSFPFRSLSQLNKTGNRRGLRNFSLKPVLLG